MKYFLVRGEDCFGPYSLDEIRQYLEAGNLLDSDWMEPEHGGQGGTVAEVLSRPVPPPIPSLPTRPTPPPIPEFAQPAQAQGASNPPLQTPLAKPSKSGIAWWLIGPLGLVALVILAFGFAIFVPEGGFLSPQVASQPLLEERQGHEWRWQDTEYESDGALETPPEDYFSVVYYPSPVGKLAAYLTADPGDGKQHPAMVWAKGGFGGIGSFLWEEPWRTNDQSARAFREAGIVLMCPSWRGEHENPGRFEFFYGEVEDLLAALEYVRALPYVDPKRVYLGGHSTGGTLTLLAAGAGGDYRAAFSFGGTPNMESAMDADEYDGLIPYPEYNLRNHQLRSPIRYTPFIRNPTFYFEGAENFFDLFEARRMEGVAKRHELPFEAYTVPGDHFDILAPTTALIAQKILADTGPECNIRFTEAELASAWNAMHNVSLMSEFQKWKEAGASGSWDPILDHLEDAAIPAKKEDVTAIRSAIEIQPPNELALENVALLATLAFDLEEGDRMLSAFNDEVVPLLRDWARKLSAKHNTFSEDDEYNWFEILDAILLMGQEDAAEFTQEMVNTGVAAENYDDWSDAFSWMDTWDTGYERLVRLAQASAPGGTVGVALVNRGNRAVLDDDWDGLHPYDSPAGQERLAAWLRQGSDSAAYEAAIALAYVKPEIRSALLDEAISHPDVDVQLEAAWADLMHDGQRGLAYLQEASRNLSIAHTAMLYMEELGYDDLIPATAQHPDFRAKAAMVDWLKDPAEIGAPPSSIEQVDTRELYWPPTDDRRPLWVFRFTYRFEENEPLRVGYGMYGSVTWSSFELYETPPTLGQLYAHHCALEIAWDDDLDEAMPAQEALTLLRKGNPELVSIWKRTAE